MDVGQGLVSSWYRDAMDIYLVGNFKKKQRNDDKTQKGRGEEKEERRENMSKPANFLKHIPSSK